MLHSGGYNNGGSGERAQPVRGVPRYHPSPRLHRVHEDGFRGTGTGGGEQQHIQPEEQAQHHQSHSQNNSSARYQHYQHQHHRQLQQQQGLQNQHHQQYRSDLHGTIAGQHPGYGNGGGPLPRSRPPLMTSHSESKAPRPGKDGLQGGASYRDGGADFNELRSSAEHSMGLKAHAAEFVPGKAGEGMSQRNGKKGVQTSGGAKNGTWTTARGTLTGSDLTAFAQEFVPGGGGGGDGGNGTKSSVDTTGRGHDHDPPSAGEKMVQVVRGGTIYFVPEREALTTDELVGVEAYGPEEDGFAWAQESAALAAPQRRTMHSTAIPENLWTEFQSQSLSVLQQLPPDDERLKEIPPQFYAAFPLDSASKTRGTAGSFGYPSETYKVIQHHNGHAYALRRFDTVRTTPKIVSMGMEVWLSMPEHPAITRPREAFMHRNALFFVSDFHPGAGTLAERFVDRQGGLLSEALLWRLVSQLLAALRVAHAARAALRNIHASRVLYCRVGDRVRVNWVGCLDVLEFETRKQVSDLQQQDMMDLGTLILVLSCRRLVTAATRAESISFLAQHYSPELHNLVVSLLTKRPSVFEVCMVTAHRTMDALENTLVANSTLQCHLSNEYDNGRLLRLLLKLGALNERPDQSGGEWAETGERYILKLFRDYCFHQVDMDGEPVLDFGHMYQTLARLDAGDEEKILLTSKDKRSLLVVSFADVKRCLEEAFSDIAGQAGVSPQKPGVGANGTNSGVIGNGGSEHGGRSRNGLRNHAASESRGGALNGVRSLSMNVGMPVVMGGGMAPAMHGEGIMRDGVGGRGFVHHGHVPVAQGHHLHGRPIMGVMGHPGPGPPQQQQQPHGVNY